jgi:CheY-like chemotaxis protein
MARIFYVHWNRDEAMETVRSLRDEGHIVIFHHSTEEGAGAEAWKSIRAKPPDAIIVSLSRLPSHGRRIAAVTTEYKALRDVPVIFVGGEDEKVAVARQEFPKARFCAPGPAALIKAIASMENMS